MKDDCTTNSHYLTYTFLFRKVVRMYFLNLGVKGLTHVMPHLTALSLAHSACSNMTTNPQSRSLMHLILLCSLQLIECCNSFMHNANKLIHDATCQCEITEIGATQEAILHSSAVESHKSDETCILIGRRAVRYILWNRMVS